ncbi:MAG: lysophospholipid acyltransferase family protein [Pirellula sp.]
MEAAGHQTYSWKDRLAYWGFRLIVALIQSLPLDRCERLAQLLGALMSRVIRIRHALVQNNLQRIFPEWPEAKTNRTQEQMWEHLVLMLCEVAHAPRKIHRENWYEHYELPDRREMLKLALDPRPKVMVSGHFGNFELAGFVTGLFGISTTTIARPLDNGFVHDYVDRFRSSGGQFMLAKSGSSSQVEALLAQGGALSLLADQYGGPKGCWVEFLGQMASCHKALALFTLSSGAPMMVCSNIRKDQPLHFEMTILGIADPKCENCPDSIVSITQWYNRCLEKAIRARPEQYWWVHHRWKGTPPARTSKSS